MGHEPQLTVRAGFASLRGRREENQDFAGFVQPTAEDLVLRGFVAAVADGCGGTLGGRTAAELCVRSFLDAYYTLPETLGTQPLVARCLAAINEWVHAVGRRDPRLAGMMTTFSALILKNRQAHVVHVGDSRVYRLRGHRLDLLTDDHSLKARGMEHVLYRAVGLEQAVPADYAVHTLEHHDRFLLCSDGLYTALPRAEILAGLQRRQTPELCARSLTEAAVERNDHDNITAVVIDVLALPLPGTQHLRDVVGNLPVLELPQTGDVVDDFELRERVSRGRYSSLFLATDRRNGATVVVKFPHPRVVGESEYHEAFLREAWIGLRIKSPWVAEILEQPPGRQTRLYSVMPYYRGKTLEAFMEEQGAVALASGIDVALKLCKAVYALHRQGVIHRDIKPDNVLLVDDGGLKLLDLGIARLPAWDEDPSAPIPGTPSYLAPEQFAGNRGSVATDVFAVGVTLYRLFTGGSYPYGEIEPFTHPRFGRPKPLHHQRPDLPAWLDGILCRSVAVDPHERYVDTIELAFELENGLAKGGGTESPPRRGLCQRHPLRCWQLTSAVLLVALLWSLGYNALHHGASRPGAGTSPTAGAAGRQARPVFGAEKGRDPPPLATRR